MAKGELPLLMFPVRAKSEREGLGRNINTLRVPDIARQRARIGPQLAVLQGAMEARRIQLQQSAPLENPELVLVLEVIGAISNFAKAVSRVEGLEWLFELAEEQIPPDDDFHEEEEGDRHKELRGRIYLLGTNQQALDQLLALWERYQRDPTAKLDHGLGPFKRIFAHLRAIRPWDATDRIGADVRNYWIDEVQSGRASSCFEIEAWYHASAAKNDAARAEIRSLIHDLGGEVLNHCIIDGIAYHGLLCKLPIESVQTILDGSVPDLILSQRIMFFRPQGQSVSVGSPEEQIEVAEARPGQAAGEPVLALLDGLPMGNHGLLAGHLTIDDPDGWEASYEAKDRVHGTAMASLIVHGELDAASNPLNRPVYVRPVMRPDPLDGYNARRIEKTPDDILLIDLIHRAVRRLFEGEGDVPPLAPTVKIINLSMGDLHRAFANEMSPWARLLDWLSYKFEVLFVVSAGNDTSTIEIDSPRGTLQGMQVIDRQQASLAALVKASAGRRLASPAESINALTVGALHADGSNPPTVPTRYDLFPLNGVSPISRVGHGYRRAVKPDLLMPGGRCLHKEQLVGHPEKTLLDIIETTASPGHRVAIPPIAAEGQYSSSYSRGTSNATALTSRAAAQVHEMLEGLRRQVANSPEPSYDAVVIKALLIHGAKWGELSDQLLSVRPDLMAIVDGNERRRAQKDYLMRWLGYGPTDVDRATTCTDQRATLLGVGALRAGEALEFAMPLPPGLAGKRTWRRVTVTLAWITPTNPTNHQYRRARLWVTQALDTLRIGRMNTDDKAPKRGTAQHEVFEGEDAVAFTDGATFSCKVNCAEDAGPWDGEVRFAICVSLEVSVETGINVYQEIQQRIAAQIPILQP